MSKKSIKKVVTLRFKFNLFSQNNITKWQQDFIMYQKQLTNL